MDWIERMNMAIDYIEAHITDKLNTEDIAKVAGCSTYHFQRMFACMTGISLSEYIRRRRMSLAVADLKSDGAKIVDVALKYDYNSPTAFNRAFQSVHGIAPSLVKLDGVSVKSYPPLSFQMVVKGVESLEFRVEKKEAFRVVGISVELYGEMEQMTEPIEQIWQIAESNGTISKLKNLMEGELNNILTVMIPDENIEGWRYVIAVATTKEIDDTLEEYIIEPYMWAIFSDEGKNLEEIEGLGYRVISEWLPTSGYEYDNGPDISVFIKDDAEGAEIEFWMPVRKSEAEML